MSAVHPDPVKDFRARLAALQADGKRHRGCRECRSGPCYTAVALWMTAQALQDEVEAYRDAPDGPNGLP